MSDWGFLHDMHHRGCSPEEIADAAATGYAPWEQTYLSREWIDSDLWGWPSNQSRFSSAPPVISFRSAPTYQPDVAV